MCFSAPSMKITGKLSEMPVLSGDTDLTSVGVRAAHFLASVGSLLALRMPLR